MKYYCKVIKPPPESGEARHSCDEMNGRDIAPYRNKKMFKKPVSKNQKLLSQVSGLISESAAFAVRRRRNLSHF